MTRDQARTHRHQGDGVELDARATGTSVSITPTPRTGDPLTILLSADQAGELADRR